jgi:hypothetical protein
MLALNPLRGVFILVYSGVSGVNASTYGEVEGDVIVLGVVDDVVLVLVDDVHCGEHVEGVVHAALHIFEVYLLPDLLIKEINHQPSNE